MSRRAQALVLLLPAALLLAVLVGGSQVLMVVASLGRRSAYGGVLHDWGLQNYVRAFDPLYLAVIGRSIVLAAATTVVCLLIGYPVAYWLARHAPPTLRRGLLVLVILPFWTSFLVRMYAWIFLLRREGLVNLALEGMGLSGLDLLYRPAAVLLGQVYGELPFIILPLYAALEKLDGELLDAAADLGATPAEVLRQVVLPLSRPGIVAGCVLVFIPSLGAYLAPDLLGGARVVYAGPLVQSQFAVARDIPFGAAVSLSLTAIVLAVLWLGRRALRALPGEHP
ncbi:MAG TPA: ABC transporter permease [Vicinamibacteria bacterium]|nr:ABC transporter permease [Vicinamibacteria bacterium]